MPTKRQVHSTTKFKININLNYTIMNLQTNKLVQEGSAFLAYDNLRNISLINQSWNALDRALIERAEKIGIRTTPQHTPAAIAARMLEYNYHQYTMYICEHPDNPEQRRLCHLSLQEAAEATFECPTNLIIASKGQLLPRPFGISEEGFEALNGPTKMPTKAIIRLMMLNQLKLPQYSSFWDIGSCTGSVSIEAKLQFPHLKVTAFELNPQGQRLMDTNSRRFGTPGIQLVIGDFVKLNLHDYPAPDAVFIDGYGKRLKEMVLFISEVLLPGGIIVMNCTKHEDKQLFIEGTKDAGLEMLPINRIALNYYSTIEVLRAVAPAD